MSEEAKPVENRSDNWIACAVCFNQRSERTPAMLVVNGISVCQVHTDLASKPSFTLWQLRSERKIT